MSDHKVQPRRQGRYVTCATCGREVIRYRATRLIRKAHWRHATWAQGALHLGNINPNRTI